MALSTAATPNGNDNRELKLFAETKDYEKIVFRKNNNLLHLHTIKNAIVVTGLEIKEVEK